MTFTIEPIAEKHIDGFWAALDYVAREKKYLAFLEAPKIESTRAFVMGNIANNYAQFVALDTHGKVVGWCDVIPNAARGVQAHMATLGIGILPEGRGRGVGRQLMQAAIAKAQQQGITRIELTVRDSNENAIALYKKLGFEVEGLKRKAACVDGVFQDTYLMALVT